MSNKKRRLTKEKEQLQRALQKNLNERKTMLWLLALATIAVVAALVARLYVLKVALSTADICLGSVLFAAAYLGPNLRIIWNNKEIRKVTQQITEMDQKINEWEQRLQEL